MVAYDRAEIRIYALDTGIQYLLDVRGQERVARYLAVLDRLPSGPGGWRMDQKATEAALVDYILDKTDELRSALPLLHAIDDELGPAEDEPTPDQAMVQKPRDGR